MASKAASSSIAATAATGSPTKRTVSRQSACSSWLTGRMPNGTGRSFPVRTASTPGILAAFDASTRTMRACGTGARCSLQNSIRGRTMSSANRVTPAHFDRPSTLRTGVPTTRRRRPSDAAAMEGLLGRPRRRILHPPRRQLHRLEDLEVAGAPAQVAREGLADLPARGARAGVEQGAGGAQDAGRAVAALCGAQLGEGDLKRVGPRTVRQPLDGDDRPPLALQGQDQAGQLRSSVHKDRAGAALAELAAVLGAGQPEVLAQDFQERLVGREGGFLILAVHVQAQM